MYAFDQDFRIIFVVVLTLRSEGSLFPALTVNHQINPGIISYGRATMNECINNSTSAYLHRSSAWLGGLPRWICCLEWLGFME
ncbi:hypothetical protein BDD14_0151 [Edaphobacter modestus]|uniref:Uncharacterized protein n=1 Tax=Edaphobacter modestus TaxID=388466 RepID=A0A4Q7YNA3_9BACT|nr:hypothetical protein BDD14_0151 [Edaphobacter modestus]